jgi:hypothetical protein
MATPYYDEPAFKEADPSERMGMMNRAMEELFRAARLTAAAAPEGRRSATWALVPWDRIEALREALERVGLEWRIS